MVFHIFGVGQYHWFSGDGIRQSQGEEEGMADTREHTVCDCNARRLSWNVHGDVYVPS